MVGLDVLEYLRLHGFLLEVQGHSLLQIFQRPQVEGELGILLEVVLEGVMVLVVVKAFFSGMGALERHRETQSFAQVVEQEPGLGWRLCCPYFVGLMKGVRRAVQLVEVEEQPYHQLWEQNHW